MLKNSEAEYIVANDMRSKLDELKEYLEKSKKVDYQKLLERAMPSSYNAFSLLLEKVPDVWQLVEVSNIRETKTMPFAIRIAQHVRHISPNDFWIPFVKKIEKDIFLQPEVQHKDLLAQLLIETDTYPVSHHELYEPINRILGREGAYNLYFENMRQLQGGGLWFVKLALSNSSVDKRVNVLKEKIEQDDFESAEIITKNVTFKHEDLKDVMINNQFMLEYLKTRIETYKNEILKDNPIKDIEQAFNYETRNNGIGKKLHIDMMNYFDLERTIKTLSKLEPVINLEESISKKRKM